MWNIVIVDDEAIIAEGLAKMIRHIGEQYRVAETFTDSVEAWRYLRENVRAVDLLITDIRMPELSGLELIERARRLRPELLCAVLTGFSEFEYAKTAINLGVVSYLVKPVETRELCALLNRLVVPAQSAAAGIATSALSRETLLMKREVETNFRDFNMDGVTERLQLSRDYLFRLFKKEMGVNLIDYLLDVRMQRAKELLLRPGEYKIYEVSERVGYADCAYFSKLFKKTVGLTPKSFQKYAKGEKA